MTKMQLLEQFLKSINLTPQSVLSLNNENLETGKKEGNVVVFHFDERQLDQKVHQATSPEGRW